MNSRLTILTVPNRHFHCSKWPERFVAKDRDAQCFCQNKLAVLVETLWFPTWIRDSWLLQIRANGPIFPNKIEHNPHCFQMSVLDTKDRSFLVPSLSASVLYKWLLYIYIYANVCTCKCIYMQMYISYIHLKWQAFKFQSLLDIQWFQNQIELKRDQQY